MRPRFRPTVERLETHVLPSTTAAAPLAVTLTTDRAVYTAGQPVHFTLTETNTSGHPVTFAEGPSRDGFGVSQGGAAVWRSNAGFVPLYLRLVTLRPGESFTLSATWDGRAAGGQGGALTGVFQAHALGVPFGENAPAARFTVRPAAPPAPAGPVTLSVATDHTSYASGQPVTVTLTETNTSRHDVPARYGAQILSGSVAGPSGTVWVYRDLRYFATYLGVLGPGQSRTLTFVWNGRANQPGARVAPGTYTVRAGVDGLTASTTVRIGS